MPKEGYSSVAVSDEVYERLKKNAEETHRTVPKLIEHMLDKLFRAREAFDVRYGFCLHKILTLIDYSYM